MNNFDKIIECVFVLEGYISDHKADTGGYTKYGISQKAHPEVDVRNLTLEDAKRIYYRKYWLPTRCDQLPFKVALFVMDMAVNSGNSAAGKALQRCVNLVRADAAKPLVVDGIIGEQTLMESRLVDTGILVAALLTYRISFYFNLVHKKPSQKVFLKGWMNRLAKINLFAAGVPADKLDLFIG